jgi:membrane-associated phospholipid phosphatase
MRNEIIPIVAAALLAIFVPIIVFLICQIRVRSFWDVNNATIGLFYSLISAAVFQVFIKWLIGGLRPHFLAVCKPRIPPFNLPSGNGYRQIMYDRSVCTGDEKEINDALESMPSGHSTAAFAGFVFLYLYLNAKLKVFSNYHPAMWKLIALYAPLLGACLIGGALTIDEYHNWYDILAGAIIGTVFAFSSYRMVYASVWDFRCKYISFLSSILEPTSQANTSSQSTTSPSFATLLSYMAPDLPPSTVSTLQLLLARRAGVHMTEAHGEVLQATLLTAHVEPCLTQDMIRQALPHTALQVDAALTVAS